MANTDHLETWLVLIKRSFQGLLGAVETVGIKELMGLWPNEVCDRILQEEKEETEQKELEILRINGGRWR